MCDRMLTVDQAAERLGVKPRWIYANHGPLRMPFRRLGNLLRVRCGDLDEWFERQP